MKNWVALLYGAHEALQSFDWSQLQENSEDDDASPALRILRSIAETTMLADLRNIRFNLDMAALYLLRLLTESRQGSDIGIARSGKMTDDAFQYRYCSIYLTACIY